MASVLEEVCEGGQGSLMGWAAIFLCTPICTEPLQGGKEDVSSSPSLKPEGRPLGKAFSYRLASWAVQEGIHLVCNPKVTHPCPLSLPKRHHLIIKWKCFLSSWHFVFLLKDWLFIPNPNALHSHLLVWFDCQEWLTPLATSLPFTGEHIAKPRVPFLKASNTGHEVPFPRGGNFKRETWKTHFLSFFPPLAWISVFSHTMWPSLCKALQCNNVCDF